MTGSPAVPSAPLLDSRWEVVERVAASHVFRRSLRSRELLLFICERALQDRGADLREQHIGCGVFGRKPNYSPGEDNIVRVEMRQLRKRLEEYFASEGKDEPYVIVVPKGTYVPVFEPRAAAVPVNPAIEKAVPAPAPRSSSWVRFVQPTALVALAAACIWLWLIGHAPPPTSAAVTEAIPLRDSLWPLLFNGTQQTFVVCADSALVVAETVLGRAVSLDDYLSRAYLDDVAKRSPGGTSMLPNLGLWQFTDIADTRLVQRLSRLNGEYWNKVTVESARNAQLQEFKNGNIILLGSVRSTPWVHLFDPMLDFQMEYDTRSQTTLVRDRSPRTGEPPVYRSAKPGSSGVAYSVLALVPNLRRTGNVLIVGGTIAESTEATGEFITNAGTSSGFLGGLIRRGNGRLPYFEALLKVEIVEGVAKDPEVAVLRILPGVPEEISGQRPGL
ncbi:MAG TPA: hypothetical protein VKB88_28295 [Bryobacteraceae bacterium]|nr:hypothetical protein [Bryobacteraceae bacterium]